MGNIGQVLGGVGSLAAGGASIYSAIQGKDQAEQARRLQQQAVDQTTALGGQSTLLGLAQLDLQRQLADRQIDLSNQVLGETQPFRDAVLGGGTIGVPERSFSATGQLTAPSFSPTLQGAAPTFNPSLYGPAPTFSATPYGAAPTFNPTTFTPTNFSVSPAERDAIEAQANNARRSAMERGVRGGQLNSQMLNVDLARAGLVTGLESENARRNVDLANQAGQYNTGILNQAGQLNLQNLLDTNRANTGLLNQAGLLNFQTGLDTTRRNTDLTNQAGLLNLQNAFDVSRTNTGLQNQAGLLNFQTGLDTNRYNSGLSNAAALTNFQTTLDRDRFLAGQGMADRQLAAQIGFNAPGVSLSGLSSASPAFSPASAVQAFSPALAAQSNAAGVYGQNFNTANQQATGSGSALGSLAAAGKLAGSKNSGKGTTSGGGFWGTG